MTRQSATAQSRPQRDATRVALRAVSGVLVAAMGVIHLYLWVDGFRDVPVIGTLFLVNAVGGLLLAVALLGAPGRTVVAVAVLAAVFTAGTLGALFLSLTVGLFGFQESFGGPMMSMTIIVESAGVVALLALATRPVVRAGRSSG